jgi:hypothetical protein
MLFPLFLRFVLSSMPIVRALCCTKHDDLLTSQRDIECQLLLLMNRKLASSTLSVVFSTL